MILAIDGPAASGKGTLARRLAAHYGLAHLDTGALYRAVAAAVLEAGEDPHDAGAATRRAAMLDPARLGDVALRAEAVGAAASVVAAHAAVRQALLDFQRAFAAAPPGPVRGAVLDGRDVGTVVCPDADVKLFVTATAAARAARRVAELRGRGLAVDPAAILADIEARDARDAGRSAAPMAQADDAALLDTTELDIEGAFAAAVAIIDARARQHERAAPAP